MGAIRLRFQTADKNITIIHKTPCGLNLYHQLMACEVKCIVFARNKSIIKGLAHPKMKLLSLFNVISIVYVQHAHAFYDADCVDYVLGDFPKWWKMVTLGEELLNKLC